MPKRIVFPTLTTIVLSGCLLSQVPVELPAAIQGVGTSDDWPAQWKNSPDAEVELTNLRGEDIDAYLWTPSQQDDNGKVVIMLHGCGGAFYSDLPEEFDAQHIAGKFKVWGTVLKKNGFTAMLVDSFTTRGYGEGVCEIDYEDRPEEINEVEIRPYDALAGFDHFFNTQNVAQQDISLLGWSNGGSATLSTMAVDSPILADMQNPDERFNQAVSLYPGCGLQSYYNPYVNSGELILMHGTADTDTPIEPCRERVQQSLDNGGHVIKQEFFGKEHGFDYKEGPTQQALSAMENAVKHFRDLP